MQVADIPNVYIAVGAGLAIWLIGQRLGSSEAIGKLGSKLGRCLSFVGFAVFAVGLFAGVRGPVTIAGITLEEFPFAKVMERADANALTYVNSSLKISRTPATTWGGISKTLLEYTVKNNGGKDIASMVVRLSTTDGSYLDLPLTGPFPGMKTTTSLVEIPPRVKRSYFTTAMAASGEVISAR